VTKTDSTLETKKTAQKDAAEPGLSYDETIKAIAELTAKLSILTAHRDVLEAAYQAGTHYEEAAKHQFQSDEGIPVAWLSGSRLMNCADATKSPADAHRLTLSVGGKPFVHKTETPGGQWVYRADA